MPYGRRARQVRGYQYGCGQPSDGESQALEAMRARIALWNSLVELERVHSAAQEAILSPFLPADGDQKARRAARRAAFERPEVNEPLARLNSETTAQARALCHESNLWWCNYEDVLLSWKQARRRPGDLKFHSSHQHNGKVTVRYQTGLEVTRAFDSDTRLQVEPVSELAWTSSVRGERRRLCRTTMRLRIGSQDRDPVWLELPVVLHRSLPADGLIRQVSVIRERVALHWRWHAVFVVETPEREPRASASSSVALDIGWRKVPAGLRVASWRGSGGESGELVVPTDWLDRMAKVDDLRSNRDHQFNAARALLAGWVKDNAIPDWLKDRTTTLRQWRAVGKLAALVLFWRQNRFYHDEETFGILESWRQHDKHHYEHEANLRDKLLVERRELYRRFAVGLTRRYGEVILEEFRLTSMAARKKKGGDADDMHQAARHQRFLASLSILRGAIQNACDREGVKITYEPAHYTTLTCHACGAIHDFDKAAILEPTCPECGLQFDQDQRAAINLLSQAGGVSGQSSGLRT